MERQEFTPAPNEIAEPTLEQQAAEMGIPLSGDDQIVGGDPVPLPPENQILGKFENYEQLEQAYSELESRMGQVQPRDSAGAMTQASEFYAQNGYLDDQSYAALEQTGLNRNYVDSYIQGIQAQQQQETQSYYDQVGGQENYEQMSSWMTQYLPDTEIDGYNRVMESGSPEEVSVLMSGMYARYAGAMNNSYSQLQGSPSSDEQSSGFESRGQIMEFLDDPRYETDAAYREEFEQRLAYTSEEVF